MAAIVQETDRADAALVDLDALDRALSAVVPAKQAVRTTCTRVRIRPDKLVLELEVHVPRRPPRHHIDGMHADVTGV